MQLRSGRSIVKSSSAPAPSPVRRPDSAPVRSSSSARVFQPMKLRSGRRLCTTTPAAAPAPAPAPSFKHQGVNSIEFIIRKREIAAMLKKRLDVFYAVKAKHYKPGSRIQSRTYYVECARTVIELFGLMNEYFDEINYYIIRDGDSGAKFLKTVKDKAFQFQIDFLVCTSKHRFRGNDSKLIYNTADELASFTKKIHDINK